MRRVCLLGIALVCMLAVAAPASAMPHLSKWQSRQISTLIDRFVTDLVEGHNLADGWKISGPDMRGALSRKVWMSGKELPVQHLDVLNNPRTSWYAQWRSDGEIGLVVSLKTGHGRNLEMIDNQTTLSKWHGQWVVDGFYSNGIFRLGKGHSGSCVSSKCKVTGMFDYAPSSSGGVAVAPPRISRGVIVAILLGILGLLVAGVLTVALVVRTRNRRARAAWLATRSS